MKFILFFACYIAAIFLASGSSDAGHFIPKAFFTLDSEGHKSIVHPVNAHTAHYLRRLRRQTVSSSSSSSSSASSDGGQTYITSQSSHMFNGVPVQVTPTFGINSRIGEDLPSTGQISQTSVFTDANGKTQVIKTTGTIDSTGKLHRKTQTSSL